MGRVYATAAQYEAYSGQTPPADIDRLLARASELLDSDVLLTAWYDTDDAGLPTNAAVIAAFSNAVSAQVEFWIKGPGESVDVSGPIERVTLGSLSIKYGAGNNRPGPTTIGDRVYRALAILPSSVFRVAVGSTAWGC
jgi:hypothetical protein